MSWQTIDKNDAFWAMDDATLQRELELAERRYNDLTREAGRRHSANVMAREVGDKAFQAFKAAA